MTFYNVAISKYGFPVNLSPTPHETKEAAVSAFPAEWGKRAGSSHFNMSDYDRYGVVQLVVEIEMVEPPRFVSRPVINALAAPERETP